MFPQIPLFPGFAISSYFLIISLATTISVLWFIRRAEAKHLARVTAIDLSLSVLIGGFLGARLLSVVFEEPEYYRLNPMAVVQIWNGGFVFLGGVVGAFVAGVLFCKIKNEPFWYWADAATLPTSLAYAIGRLACFMNGCCYGKPAAVPWAIVMHGAARHPTQLYASLMELLLFGILTRTQLRFKTSGVLFNTWIGFHAMSRLIMEHFRDDPRGQLLFGTSLGTVMSLLLMLWAVVNIVASRLQP